MLKKLLIIIMFCFTITNSFGLDRKNRLGIGLTDQLLTGQSISLKIQKSKAMAFGILGKINTSENKQMGAGVKLYRIVFDEPNLNFYVSALGALVREDNNGESKSGFQFDFSMGPEFSFPGLHSIGLSFEVGASVNTMDDVTISTATSGFVIGAIHFYL